MAKKVQLMTNAKQWQVVDGVEYPVKAGDALFINYGSTHAIEVVGDLIYADIIIKPEYISESLKGVENAFALLELDGFKEFAKTVDRNDRMMHFSEPQRKQIEGLIMSTGPRAWASSMSARASAWRI